MVTLFQASPYATLKVKTWLIITLIFFIWLLPLYAKAEAIFVEDISTDPRLPSLDVSPSVSVNTSIFISNDSKTVVSLSSVKYDYFAIGNVIPDSLTSRIVTQEELIIKAAGKPQEKSFLRYQGNFKVYWYDANSRSSFEGKAFEAMLAHQENKQLASMGDNRRLVVTAVEGFKSHPADLIMLDSEGRVITQYQLKMGVQATLKSLNDPKYTNMKILTTWETMDVINRDLAKAKDAAMRRGIPLSAYWQKIEDELRPNGRLVQELPSGQKLLLREEVEQLTRIIYNKIWSNLSTKITASMQQHAPRMVAQLEKLGVSAILLRTNASARIAENRTLKVGAKVLKYGGPIIDVGSNIYLTYSDYQRFHAGEIGSEYLGFKGVLRGTQVGLTYYTFFAPDPTQVTRVITGTLAIALLAADIVSDPFYEAALQRTQELLDTIDRDEQFSTCRQELKERLVFNL